MPSLLPRRVAGRQAVASWRATRRTRARTLRARCTLRRVQDAELLALLEKKANPICYDGFEPSGRMHIAQGILKAINVNRCGIAAGPPAYSDAFHVRGSARFVARTTPSVGTN